MIRKQLIAILLVAFIGLAAKAQEHELKPLGLNLENYEYPFDVNYFELELHDGTYQMAYMDVRPAHGNGQTVVLLHGKNFNGAYWEETAQRLVTEEGFRVIIPDQIGFGKSTKPDFYPYTFQQLAMNTKALLDSLGIERANILGHSMGGMLASRFALMFPELTNRLIFVNPIGLEDWKLKVPYQSVEWWYQLELKKDYKAIRQYQLKSYYDNKWRSEYDQWVNLLAGWTLSIDYPKIAWNAALTYDMIFTQPVCYEFENIQVPTLLIIGQRDRTALGKPLVDEKTRETMGLYPELGRLTHQKIPNSQLVELDDVGHLPHIEAFGRFIDPLIKFLKED